jgi:hypothetical protein
MFAMLNERITVIHLSEPQASIIRLARLFPQTRCPDFIDRSVDLPR